MSEITAQASALDMQKVEQFAGQFISDLSASYSGVMTLLGHELGLYKAMEESGPISSAELAAKTGTFARYVREWLNNQAAGGYLEYYPEDGTYSLPAEHALVLAQENSPAFMLGGYQVVSSMWHDQAKLADAFLTGKGIGWHEHNHNLYHGVESIYRAGYIANLTEVWIPALEGAKPKLQIGARVADIGCGHGASTILMAKKFPNSTFIGYDYHRKSIEVAQQNASEEGLENVSFELLDAEGYEHESFDLICFFDCFHDFGNPLKALTNARKNLAPGGSIMLVEPNANDRVEENFTPIGRMFYAASTALCVPHSHSEEGDYCLGAQAGPSIVERISKEAGFTRFRIADQSPVNLVYELKI